MSAGRVIKFRAWHTELKRMRYFTDFSKLLNRDSYMCVGDFEWMQFTGIHDKNGKEVWEGDVVKVRNWTPIGKKPTYSKILVEYRQVSGSDDMGTDMVGFIDHSGDEVVGNIYENPELLKGVR